MTNVPVPSDTNVPSAEEERRRIRIDNLSGVAVYVVAVICVSAALILAVFVALSGP